MKKIVRLNENDLSRIVRRVIRESEEALIDQIDSELDSVDENNPDPGLLERIVNKIQDAGHDVEMFMRKLRRNRRKLSRNVNRFFKRMGKRFVRATHKPGMAMESFDLRNHRELQYLLRESEEALANEIDMELDSVDENNPDPGLLERIVNKIQDAGHDVEMFMRKLRRNGRKLQNNLSRFFEKEGKKFRRSRRMMSKNLRKVGRSLGIR